MIVVQAAQQTVSRNTACKTEKEVEQNGKHKLYVRNKHRICLLHTQNVPWTGGLSGISRQGGHISAYFSFSMQM